MITAVIVGSVLQISRSYMHACMGPELMHVMSMPCMAIIMATVKNFIVPSCIVLLSA